MIDNVPRLVSGCGIALSWCLLGSVRFVSAFLRFVSAFLRFVSVVSAFFRIFAYQNN